MDLFDSLPNRPDGREGWEQFDLFVERVETAREQRLKMRARPRLSITSPRQLPLVAAVRPEIPCGEDGCRLTFPNPRSRQSHITRTHRGLPETETEIRERIRAFMADAGTDRREGEVA